MKNEEEVPYFKKKEWDRLAQSMREFLKLLDEPESEGQVIKVDFQRKERVDNEKS